MYFILAAPHDRAHPEGTRYPDGSHDIAISGEFPELISVCRKVLNNVLSFSEYLHDHLWNVLGIPVCQNWPHRCPGRRSRFLQLHGVPRLQRAPEPPTSYQGWRDVLKICKGTGTGTNDQTKTFGKS